MRFNISIRRFFCLTLLLFALPFSHADMTPVITQIRDAAEADARRSQTFRKAIKARTGNDARPVADIAHTSGARWTSEVEPNGDAASASPITLNNGAALIQGNLFPNGDVDYYSFQGNAGDRVYAALMTAASAGSSTDSQLTLLDTDGTTVIEFDDDNGTSANLSSSIAGAVLPANGTYYIKVNDFTAGTTTERYYRLFLRVQTGAPTAEAEPNDTPATANPLPSNGWISGARNPAAGTEQDWFSVNLNAGDTVFLSLDLDPERDGTVWNGRLGFALFGDAGNQIIVVDDPGATEAPNPTRPSEAMFVTVKNAGTYYAFVDSASAGVGGDTATYGLSVTVFPKPTVAGSVCTTYTSSDVPQTLGPANGLSTSTITIPGNPRVDHLAVSIQLNHALMAELDVSLTSPGGNEVGLFTDIGSAATGGQTQMDATFDDDAATPPTWTVVKGLNFAPELAYRLAWFQGIDAGGTWTLNLRDDTAGANGGTLTGWSVEVCEPAPAPTCAPGFTPVTVFTTDFETDSAGFTHTGTADQWALGLPNTAATTTANPVAEITNCNSGLNCWKTNLSGTYAVNSSQDLLSPNIDLTGYSAPVVVRWAHKYQMESANFDHYSVDLQQVGGATPSRLFDWLGATMTNAPGNPAVNVPASAGWAQMSVRADSLAGLNTELKFHLDSDTTIGFAGVAVDDVSVTACRPMVADLSITNTDGETNAVPGATVTYMIVASNAGTDPAASASVTDTFPAACASVAWTCSGAGGGSCSAAGAGNISDTVNLPAGASVTFTATCTIGADATGVLTNTAVISSSITDSNPANNSATDSDTLTPQADLSINVTDGVTGALPGTAVTYTIVASNAGPSNAPATTVTDIMPPPLTGVTWTCVGAGGATCTAAGSGNINDTVNLPAGASVIYTVTATLSPGASGTLSNTATVTADGAIADTVPGNNSATDSDTIGILTFAISGAASSGNGTVSCVSPVALGSSTTCIVTPDTGHRIVSVSGCGGTPGSSSPYLTGPITGACTVTATFALIPPPAVLPEAIPAMSDAALAVLILLLVTSTAWSGLRRRR